MATFIYYFSSKFFKIIANKKTIIDNSIRFLVLSFTSDWLYPTSENKKIVKVFNSLGLNVSFIEIETENGHDSFLLDEPKFFEAIKGFINSTFENL